LTAGILAWLGVQQAPLFGLMAFLLNFIPNLGAFVAVLLPLPLVLLQDGAGSSLALAALLPAAVQLLLGGVLEPRLMGRAMGLHPVTVLLGLLVWASLWGPAGMVLAVPLTSVCRLLFERQEALRPVARWMEGDAAAGTP
jgi:AI-2 transport protein TqsA